MVFGRQHADCAGRFGHAIYLNELRVEHIHRLSQQLERDRRRTVQNIFQTAVIHRTASRVIDHHLQGGRHNEQPRRAAFFNRVKNRIRRKFGQNQTRQARRKCHDAEPRPANMRAGHGDKDDFIILPFGIGMVGIGRMLAQGKQVAVRQHGALRITRSA